MKVLQIQNNIFKILIELFILDRKKRGKIKARWAKMHLKKYVEKALKDIKYSKVDDTPVNKIWIYWHQGIDNAPELIKKCIESIRYYESDKEINILSFDNISDYVDIPERYYNLLNNGKMKIAHFSDIVRLYLLEKYGGTWIDATIYLTAPLPKEITNSTFFVPRKDINTDGQENIMFCFFITAKKGSKNITALKACLDLYWSKNDFVLNYFMFEHLSTLLYSDPELKKEWDDMPNINLGSHADLQAKLFNSFNVSEFKKMNDAALFHKLTYKNVNKREKENTYYEYIVKNKVPLCIDCLEES